MLTETQTVQLVRRSADVYVLVTAPDVETAERAACAALKAATLVIDAAEGWHR